MLQISNIDKHTEDVLFYLVKKNGGTIISYKEGEIDSNNNELNLPDNYSEEQIRSINNRWKKIEKSYLDEEKKNNRK